MMNPFRLIVVHQGTRQKRAIFLDAPATHGMQVEGSEKGSIEK
jgi:hypothetical protein